MQQIPYQHKHAGDRGLFVRAESDHLADHVVRTCGRCSVHQAQAKREVRNGHKIASQAPAPASNTQRRFAEHTARRARWGNPEISVRKATATVVEVAALYGNRHLRREKACRRGVTSDHKPRISNRYDREPSGAYHVCV